MMTVEKINVEEYRQTEDRKEYLKAYYRKRIAVDKLYGYKSPSPELREYTFKRKNRLKNEVFEHYGRQCLYCGEIREEYLCLDHVNNDGYEYRNKNIKGWYTGAGWLKRNSWPNNVVQILCYNCNQKKYLKRFKKDSYSRITLYWQRIKLSVKEKYGNKCAVCGCNDIEILQLDHVNGGGNAERRELGKGRKGVGARKIYKKLYDEPNTLPEYRLLCSNCNMVHI